MHRWAILLTPGVILLTLGTPLAQPTKTPATVKVAVYPEAATLTAGTSKSFKASVTGTNNTAVTWWVNNVQGGNATLGTIDAGGNYASPAKTPNPNVVTVKAVSKADTTKWDTSPVTIVNPAPAIKSFEPGKVNTGLAVTVRILGANFLPTAILHVDGKPVAARFVSPTELQYSFTPALPAESVYKLMVLNPDPGAAKSSEKGLPVAPPVTLSVSPEKKTLRAGDRYDFQAWISHHANKAARWSVNGVRGGNAVLGTIDAEGLYTAPAVVPPGGGVTIEAASEADPRATDTSAVTLWNAIPAIQSVTPGVLSPGTATLTVTGTGFAQAAKGWLGAAALATQWISPAQLRLSGEVKAVAGNIAALTVVNPDPGEARSNTLALAVRPARQLLSAGAAARLLEQASWGPTPESLMKLQETGIQAWLNDQFAQPPSSYPDPANESEGLSRLQKAFFFNAMTGRDQLRQRVAFALGQILVVSGVEAGRFHQMVPYQRLMMNHAFGNYFDLLREVTLSPTMGIFLDMVNNAKPDARRGTVPNENYARELLQLFTIGLFELNANGTRRLDGAGRPIASYTEETVKEFTLAFTGWTFPPQPGFASRWKNPEYFFGQMVPFDEHHDMTEKALLNGVILPPGRTAREDLEAALANIYSHSNVAPFVSYRLIQRLVTGNPTPAYVGRVAAVFNGGVKGDLKAVVRAILTDPEAGNPATTPASATFATPLPPDQGHLREPVLYATALLRALGAEVTVEPNIAFETEAMGQRLFFPPSVFNYFSPFFRPAGWNVTAPEFQILNPTTALGRVNFVYDAVRNGISGSVKIDTSNFEALAEDPALLVEAVNNALFRGSMEAAMKGSILKALQVTQDRRWRARNALYLAGSAGLYQVQR